MCFSAGDILEVGAKREPSNAFLSRHLENAFSFPTSEADKLIAQWFYVYSSFFHLIALQSKRE